MINLERLGEILAETTQQFRKTAPLTEANHGPLRVTTIDFNPPVSEAREGLEMVDLVFLVVGVDKSRAQAHRAELFTLLSEWPDVEHPLSDGPSYIHVGGILGDQGAAFQLFAIGKVLGFWGLITPATFHVDDPGEAEMMAGRGYIMIDGFRDRE